MAGWLAPSREEPESLTTYQGPCPFVHDQVCSLDCGRLQDLCFLAAPSPRLVLPGSPSSPVIKILSNWWQPTSSSEHVKYHMGPLLSGRGILLLRELCVSVCVSLHRMSRIPVCNIPRLFTDPQRSSFSWTSCLSGELIRVCLPNPSRLHIFCREIIYRHLPESLPA